MKTKTVFGLILILVLTVSANYAQEVILTTNNTNIVASKATIDQPGLTGNANAIIVATPIGETQKLNPHQIGAWYYNNKWNIFNTDHATMPAGLKFKVEVFLKPDENHFLHVVTKQNLIGEVSYIDNLTLNSNPNAQITLFQNHAPDYRSGFLNKFEAKAKYDATTEKWYIKNVGGETLNPNTAYNIIVFSDGRSSSVNKAVSISELNIKPTISASPTPTPSNMPVGTVITPISNLAPPESVPLQVIVRTEFTIPQWNLSLSPGFCKAPVAIYTNPNILITDNVIVTGQYADGFMQLRWSALVSNGSVLLTVCNNSNSVFGSSTNTNISYRKVNILVLR